MRSISTFLLIIFLLLVTVQVAFGDYYFPIVNNGHSDQITNVGTLPTNWGTNVYIDRVGNWITVICEVGEPVTYQEGNIVNVYCR